MPCIFIPDKEKLQLLKEQKKFISKFGSLSLEKAEIAKSHRINKEILSNTSNF